MFMGKRFFLLCLTIFVAGLTLTSCNEKQTDFLFTYSMESVDNYKIAVTVKGDKSYKIEEYNYFMDNQANRKDPKIKEGIFAEEEFSEMRDRIFRSKLLKMDDAYGFQDGVNPDLGGIMYQIYFASGGDEKYISIAYDKDVKFPSAFVDLVSYLNDFLSKNKIK